MATEIEITSYRNILDILGDMKTTLKRVNELSILGIAAGGAEPGVAILKSTFGGSGNPKLTGFALTLIDKVGNKQEWPELLKRRGVFKGIEPTFFVHQAYAKATGQTCTPQKRPFGTVCKEALGPFNVNKMNAGGFGMAGTSHLVYEWIGGQIQRLNFAINDLVRQSDALQMEINRVRIPMPPKFKKWIIDLRDTAITVSASPDSETRAINCFRLWELTTFKGELVTDFQIIKRAVDKEIAAIEKGASAPAKKPAKVKKSAPVKVNLNQPATKSVSPPVIFQTSPLGPTGGFVPPNYRTQVEPATPPKQGQDKTTEPATDEKKLPGWLIPAIGIASAILFKG